MKSVIICVVKFILFEIFLLFIIEVYYSGEVVVMDFGIFVDFVDGEV